MVQEVSSLPYGGGHSDKDAFPTLATTQAPGSVPTSPSQLNNNNHHDGIAVTQKIFVNEVPASGILVEEETNNHSPTPSSPSSTSAASSSSSAAADVASQNEVTASSSSAAPKEDAAVHLINNVSTVAENATAAEDPKMTKKEVLAAKLRRRHYI